MRKFLLICCVGAATILCSCTCSTNSYTNLPSNASTTPKVKVEDQVIDSWKVWVVGKTIYYTYDYFHEKCCNAECSEKIFHEGMKLKVYFGTPDGEYTNQWESCAKEFDGLVYSTASKMYKKLLLEDSYKNDDEIIEDVLNEIWTSRRIEDKVRLLSADYEYISSLDQRKYVGKANYEIEWIFSSEDNLKILKEYIGKFSDFRKFVYNSVSVHSSSLIRSESLYKLYEVIYHISFDDVSRYVLCNILIQNDGSSEIEIIDDSRSLMDLI